MSAAVAVFRRGVCPTCGATWVVLSAPLSGETLYFRSSPFDPARPEVVMAGEVVCPGSQCFCPLEIVDYLVVTREGDLLALADDVCALLN